MFTTKIYTAIYNVFQKPVEQKISFKQETQEKNVRL